MQGILHVVKLAKTEPINQRLKAGLLLICTGFKSFKNSNKSLFFSIKAPLRNNLVAMEIDSLRFFFLKVCK